MLCTGCTSDIKSFRFKFLGVMLVHGLAKNKVVTVGDYSEQGLCNAMTH